MSGRLAWIVATLATLALTGGLALMLGYRPVAPTALPRIGTAPDFMLTTHDGERLSLDDLRGKVVAITFIFASCTDACPLLTAKMVGVQSQLGPDFGPRARFLSITVDPERDTLEVLQKYARAHAVNPAGWAFLTGTPAEIFQVARDYGVFFKKTPGGDVDHTFLTSLVDRGGTLRVQYLGTRFDPDELLRDIRALVRER